jgi:predicted nucleic acid-binding protein
MFRSCALRVSPARQFTVSTTDGRLATYQEWRKIVVAEGVSGIQVHDARLVATMRIHRIEHLLTLNVGDFRRYDRLIAVSPQDLLAQFG